MKCGWAKLAREEFQELERSSIRLRDISDPLRRNFFPTATLPSSLSKNRYPDILPFENTRVCLESNHTDGSDYINANFVLDQKYISCQAPLYPTIADFWKMVWEQKSIVIVMLTNLIESGRIKAIIYWPIYVDNPVTYGDITVTLVAELKLEHFVLRYLNLQKGDEFRQIIHVHYTEWPDHGVPKLTRGILCLCKQINIFLDDALEISPIIVHCSAGIGRSGSFITIHHAINQIDRNQSYDILSTAKQLRRDRIGMIQTEEQYRLIYQTIKDYHKVNLCQLSEDELSTSPLNNISIKTCRNFSEIPSLVSAL
jgi:protein tyrosine phosphatase